MILYKQFTFDAAHFLPNVPKGHKCNQLHGHTYTLKVYVKGEPDKKLGWVIDFNEVRDAVKPVIDQVDHELLNNITGLENPTSELTVIWLWNRIKPNLKGLVRLELNETLTTGVIYEGD